MRSIPPAMQAALDARDFTGSRRAVSRATIQIAQLGIYPVDAGTLTAETYSSIVFPQVATGAMELPNLKSVSWQRSVDQQIASCTLSFYNTRPLPPGSEPPLGDNFDQEGYYTYNRGQAASSTAWGQLPNEWQDYLVPDRIIRLYQGYGADFTQLPENDPHLLLMGCWIIDDVTYGHDGTIDVECRDFGRMLAEQICFPPVVPVGRYPLYFVSYHQVKDPPRVITTGSIDWVGLTYDGDSNVPYVGRNGTEHGHHGTDAFDSNDGSFWLSIGNNRSVSGYSFEYIQGAVTGKISAARCHVWGGPYKVYLSVRVGSTWAGTSIVPYVADKPPAAPNGANIPYIWEGTVDKDGVLEVPFPELDGVTAVRFCFTNLYNSGLGPYVYRAGVRSMSVIRNTQVSTTAPTTYHTEGNFRDWTDVIKLLLAYGGFYWPPNASQQLTGSNVAIKNYTAGNDPFLGVGRIWGDLEVTGSPTFPDPTAFNQDLTTDVFNMKPILDVITLIRDQLGFLFVIDENGGAIWRLPNYFQLGSIAIDADGQNGRRTQNAVHIKDDEMITSLRSKLSSRNSREKVVTANLSANLAAVASISSVNPRAQVNFRRMTVWTNLSAGNDAIQTSITTTDLQVAADLLTLQYLFSYRQNSLTIPADPRIQIDDQVILSERITGEDYRHYVTGIQSDWNVDDGRWTYQLTTNWLGESPNGVWAFDINYLSPETQAYLQNIIAGEETVN